MLPKTPTRQPEAADDELPPPAVDPSTRPAGGDGGGEGRGDADERRLQGALAGTDLQVEGDEDPHARHAEEVQQRDGAAAGEARDRKDRQVDHGAAAGVAVVALPPHPGPAEQEADGQARPVPGRAARWGSGGRACPPRPPPAPRHPGHRHRRAHHALRRGRRDLPPRRPRLLDRRRGRARGSRGRPAGAWRAHRGRRTRGRAGLGLSEPKVVCATGSPAGRRALRSVAGAQDYRFNTQPSLGGSPPDRRRSHLVDFIR